MSTCISRHGEYGSHVMPETIGGDDEFVCTRCGVLDEDAMRDELNRSRETRQKLAARLGSMVESINEQMKPEILRQKTQAWDEGYRAAVLRPCRNPYRKADR